MHAIGDRRRKAAEEERENLVGDFDPNSRAAKHFWEKRVKKAGPDECWEWIGTPSHAYGLKRWIVGGVRRFYKASRLSFLLSGGVLTDERPHVLHSCDNPRCVNPAHLRAGSQKENMADMSQRERRQDPRGEKNGKAKFTEQQVRDIRKKREQGASWAALAREYGSTNMGVIYVVKHGWRHVK